MTKVILRKDWFFEVWEKWKDNPSEVERTRGTHPFGGGHTEIFTGQHPESMKNNIYYLQYIDKYKTKVNMSSFPSQIDNFINISMKDDIFDISKKTDGKKPYLVFIENLLEHISFNVVGELLVKVYDKMELNGEIIIKTTNLQEVIKRYAEGNLPYVEFIKLMYGEQKESFDYHSCIYNQEAMKALLEDVGFSIISMETIENNMFLYVVARKCKELS